MTKYSIMALLVSVLSCFEVSAHNYDDSGFCTDAGCTDPYQEPSKTNGVYQINKAGHLWWLAKHVNIDGGGQDCDAKLIKEIDMGGSARGSFPGIGRDVKKTVEDPTDATKTVSVIDTDFSYGGTFDGNGKTIKNFYREVRNTFRQGLFNYVCGTESKTATIKNFTLSGKMEINTTNHMHGAVVGELVQYALLQDVTSSVTISVNLYSGDGGTLGGVVGCISGGCTVDRCRFNGTLDAKNFIDGIGGIAGEIRTGTMKNCLFDGTITSSYNSLTGTTPVRIGGLIGLCSQGSIPSIQFCYSNGTITLNNAANTESGVVLGCSTIGIKLHNVYYNDANCSAGLKPVGSITPSALALGTPISATGMAQDDIRWMLGQANWKIASMLIPGTGGKPTHTHSYDSNGFCTANDFAYQEATAVNSVYQISNAGQLYWYAEQINAGKNPTSKAILTKDIDLEGARYQFPGIGTEAKPYKGTFDGNKMSIKNLHITALSNRTGLFGCVEGATIKNLKISGDIICPTIAVFIGPIAQAKGNCTIFSIQSDVNIQVLVNKVRGVGGIVGVAEYSGSNKVKMDQCRYFGTITIGSDYLNQFENGKKFYPQAIGGICGNLRGSEVHNSLFDGSITANHVGNNVGGIVGAITNNGSNVIYDCYSNGTINVSNNDSLQNGVMVGYIETPTEMNHSFYNLGKVTGLSTAIGKSRSTVTNTDGGCTEKVATLDDLGRKAWEYRSGIYYPVPGWGAIPHTHQYVNGYCVSDVGHCDKEIEIPVNSGTETSPKYEIGTAAALFWFAEQFNSKALKQNSSVVLTADIDMGGREFAGIGNSNWKFTRTFNGNGHTIKGFKRTITTDQAFNNQGFFNEVNGATIRDFSLQGEMSINNKNALYGSIVGASSGSTTIEDVTSSVNIKILGIQTNLSDQNGVRVIGGIGGRIAGTINRCRYNGTITLSDRVGDRFAGLIGEVNGLTMSNCLFDGKILATNTNYTKGRIAGLTTKINGGKNKIVNCYSCGTFEVGENVIDKLFGIVCCEPNNISFVNTYYYYDNYYKKNGVSVDQPVSQETKTRPSGIIDATNIGWTDLRDALDADNSVHSWEIMSGQDYPIPTLHKHNYADNNGYCTINRCDQLQQQVTKVGDYYEVGNKGQFKSAVDLLASDQTLKIKLTKDVNLDNETISAIGPTASNPFKGELDGDGHTISGFHRTIDSQVNNASGLVNYANGATIKNLHIEGDILITGADSTSQKIGGLVGSCTTSTIENVTSSVNISTDNTCDGSIASGLKYLGGIVGAGYGDFIIQQCRYNGTMTFDASTDQIGDGFGGIMGYCDNKKSSGAQINNCLFDGKITNMKNQTSGGIGGIIGCTNKERSTIHQCISVGIIELQSYDYSGMILGSGSLTKDNSYYLNNISAASGTGTLNKIGTETTLDELKNGEICATLNAVKNNANKWSQVISNSYGDIDENTGLEVLKYPLPSSKAPVSKDGSNNYSITCYRLADDPDAPLLPSDANSVKSKRVVYHRTIIGPADQRFITACMPFEISKDMLPENSAIKLYDQVVYVASTNSRSVHFKTYDFDKKGPLAAGTPCFIYIPEGEHDPNWLINEYTDSGFPIATSVANPTNDPSEYVAGIYGSMSTILTGAWNESSALIYKVNSNGNALVKTKATSNCWAYRAYLKLPLPETETSVSSASSYRISFFELPHEEEEEEVEIEDPTENNEPEKNPDDVNGEVTAIENLNVTCPKAAQYNLYGQRLNHGKGLMVQNRKIILQK